MMHKRRGRSVAGGMLAVLVLAGGAWGQDPVGLGTSDGLPPGYRTNPFAHPANNPFLNPYAAASRGYSRDEVVLHFLAARQAHQIAQQRAAIVPRLDPRPSMPYGFDLGRVPAGEAAAQYFQSWTPHEQGRREHFGRGLENRFNRVQGYDRRDPR